MQTFDTLVWYILQRFRPMSLERPKVLLPLVGAPLIDYTLEWLASNNVAEVRLLSPSSSLYVICMQGPACEPLDGVQSMHASVPCAGVRILLRARRAGEGALGGCRLAAGQSVLPREGESTEQARGMYPSYSQPACQS